jgi:uncharacterized protein YxjI
MSQRPNPSPDDELELDWGARARPGQPASDAASTPALGLVQEGAPGKGMPGDPKHMSEELRLSLSGLLEGPGIRVRQMRAWAEILVGWETRNRYEACDVTGRPVVYVGETGEGLGHSLLRNFWFFHRMRLECMTLGGTLALTVERPWTFFFARAEVTAWDGRPLGTIEQRLTFLGRRLAILSHTGVELATVEGPLLKPWTFQVKQRGVEVAVIRKKWGGLAREFFSQEDDFGVEFLPGCTDPRLRQLILGATLLVDVTWFEKRERSWGRDLSLLPDVFD